MQATHSLLECPLYSFASLTIDTMSRTIVHASKEMIQLLDNEDPTGTRWPSKQEQQLCFTTLVNVRSSKQQKRLLTCEHTSSPSSTVHCADISALEQLYSNKALFNSFISYGPTLVLRMNPYGVIQACFASPSCSSPPTTAATAAENQLSSMVGQPLMRFVHNDDIPILCRGLRQVTQCHQQATNDNNYSESDSDNDDLYDDLYQDEDQDDGDDDDDTDNHDGDNHDGDITMVSFDIRCNFDLDPFRSTNDLKKRHHRQNSSNGNISKYDSGDNYMDKIEYDTGSDHECEKEKDAWEGHDTFYHFSTVVTSTQDILCVMRPSSPSAMTNKPFPSITSQKLANAPPSHQGTIGSFASFCRFSSSLICSSGDQLKHMVHRLQQALWDAVEQGLMMLAHYLAAVMVMALQYYRFLASNPSFWLETSELAFRCLLINTKSRPELDRFFTWLEGWPGLKSSRHLFGSALDHGSEWFFSWALRTSTSTTLSF